MDAERLDFPDASFDVVVAHYVVNTVPHPEAALDEFARVLKPGGEMVIINRVGAEDGARRVFEQWFQPLATKLGWRSEFPWSGSRSGRTDTAPVRLIERQPCRRSAISPSSGSARSSANAEHEPIEATNCHPSTSALAL